MNYAKIYKDFIKNRRVKPIAQNIYTERHHIVPRSHGGNNDNENMIMLSAEDHFFAHRLLAKIHGGGMWTALFFMCHIKSNSAKGITRINRRAFGEIRAMYRLQNSKQSKGSNNTNFGKTHSKETRKKISDSKKKYVLANHPKAINDVFRFVHENGSTFTGSHFDFCAKYGHSVGSARKLCKGDFYSLKGWRVPSTGKTDNRSGPTCKAADKNIYEWTAPSGKIILATRCEMVSDHGLTGACLYLLVRGLTKTHKGWTVKNDI